MSAKKSIYTTIDELKRKGQAVLIVTSDDGDLEVCDRVVAMLQGEVSAELRPPFNESMIAAAVQGSGTAAEADRRLSSGEGDQQ